METAIALTNAYKRAAHNHTEYCMASSYSGRPECPACNARLMNLMNVACNQVREFRRCRPDVAFDYSQLDALSIAIDIVDDPIDRPQYLVPPHTCGTGNVLSIAEAAQINAEENRRWYAHHAELQRIRDDSTLAWQNVDRGSLPATD